MFVPSLGILKNSNARKAGLISPREHGAWGMLLVPLLTGACIGFAQGNGWPCLAFFVLTVLALFCLRAPAEAWLGASPCRPRNADEKRAVILFMILYGAISAASLTGLLILGKMQGFLILGGVAGAAFAGQSILRKLLPRTRMVAQTIGALGLTSTAAGAYYAVTGTLDQTALVLWLANWIFAGNQIHFVQLRLHAARAAGWQEKLARGGTFLLAEAIFLAMLLLAWREELLPALALMAFVPVLVRGPAWFLRSQAPLNVRRLGLSELAYALAFGILLIAGFHLRSF
jgi:YwiC-like protein